jgi:hypothetical protein
MAGVALYAVGDLTNRQAAFMMLALIAAGRILRLWALSHERKKAIPASDATSLLRLASRVTLLECLAFGGAWLGWRLMQSPQFDPDSMVLQAVLIPWASLFFVVSSLAKQESNAADL